MLITMGRMSEGLTTILYLRTIVIGVRAVLLIFI